MDRVTKHNLKNICVFCGSKFGSKPVYREAARALGQELVKQRITLVYGGGTVGLMGEIARTVADGLGDDHVIGVIPEALQPVEISNGMIGRTQVVQDMHQRKALMAKNADGFIAMPGGYGTMEELMEVVTWQQLGYHVKPVGLLNTNGFFDSLLEFFKHSVEEGFVGPAFGNIILVDADPERLIQRMREYQAPVSVVASAAERKLAVGEDISGAGQAPNS